MGKTLSIALLPTTDGKRKNANSKTLFAVANCSYGDFRKDYISALLTGSVKVTDDGNITWDDKANKLCAHRKAKECENFDYEAANMKSHDGWLVCEEKQIPAVTKAINDFFNHASIKAANIINPITLLRECVQYTGDTKVLPTAKAIINEAVPAAE